MVERDTSNPETLNPEPPTSKADLILHPVRLRILAEVVGKELTTRQIASVLPDVPQASLYRHIGVLLEANMLEVVAEQRVNGAVERTLRVARGQDRISPEELSQFSKEDHLRYFNLFAYALIERFGDFVSNAEPQAIPQSGMSYNRTVVYLSDTERSQLQQQLFALLGTVMSHQPNPERKRYTLASVVIPDERKTP